MKQYRITDDEFTLEDIPGYDDNAKHMAEYSLKKYREEENAPFKKAKLQERDVSEWKDVE